MQAQNAPKASSVISNAPSNGPLAVGRSDLTPRALRRRVPKLDLQVNEKPVEDSQANSLARAQCVRSVVVLALVLTWVVARRVCSRVALGAQLWWQHNAIWRVATEDATLASAAASASAPTSEIAKQDTTQLMKSQAFSLNVFLCVVCATFLSCLPLLALVEDFTSVPRFVARVVKRLLLRRDLVAPISQLMSPRMALAKPNAAPSPSFDFMEPGNASSGAPLTSKKRKASLVAKLMSEQVAAAAALHNNGDEQELPQLRVVDECDKRATSYPVNSREPIAFENEFFKGKFLVMVRNADPNATKVSRWHSLFGNKRRMMWVQVQGQFKKDPPPGTIFLAGELPSRVKFGFVTKQLVSVLVSVVQNVFKSVHLSFGEESCDQLPHTAFPLYESADEMVITPLDAPKESFPQLGTEKFGESALDRSIRMGRHQSKKSVTPVFDTKHLYSFQFHTMYVDLSQWLIVNLPGMPEMTLKRFIGENPLRLACYQMPAPTAGATTDATDAQATTDHQPEESHAHKNKKYLFCFSLHYDPKPKPNALEMKMTCASQSAAARRAVRLQLESASSVKQMTSLERAHSLSSMTFQLKMWVEVVDPIVGNRKVAYLFRVLTPRNTQKTILRSVGTIQNVLNHNENHFYKRLTSESREYLYESIENERTNVAEQLQLVAMSSTDVKQRSLLYNCLTTPGPLPKARVPAELGLQLAQSKREQMDILFEKAVFRVHSDTFLRQEWFILTTSELLFFRSFSVRPERNIPISQIIAVKPWELPILQEEDMYGFGNRWYCVQLVLLGENIKFVVENELIRTQFIDLLNQLLRLKSNANVEMMQPTTTSLFGRPAAPHQNAFILNKLETFQENQPQLSPEQQAQPRKAVELAERLLEKALELYEPAPETFPTREALMEFFDEVTLLRVVSLTDFKSHEQKLCFFLNVYHVLFIHSTLVYGKPRCHAHWKQLRHVPGYLLGRENVHVTLGEIEHCILRARMPAGGFCTEVPISSNDAMSGASGSDTTGRMKRFPHYLFLDRRDFRTSFALQLNTKPNNNIMRVYHPDRIHAELNESCAEYLSYELRIDQQQDLVYLPQLCEWFREDYTGVMVSNNEDGLVSENDLSLMCVHKLMGFMRPEQRDQLESVLLKKTFCPSQIKYNKFWTKDASIAATLLQSFF